jgi:hypothetical protein
MAGYYNPKIPLYVIRNYQSRQGLHFGRRIDKWKIFVPLGTTHAGWVVGEFMHVPYLTARLGIRVGFVATQVSSLTGRLMAMGESRATQVLSLTGRSIFYLS